MDREKRLAVLVKIRDRLQEVLQSAINNDQVTAENRTEVLSSLAKIQREIESLQKPEQNVPDRRNPSPDEWPEST
jgi:hypothetical protein